MSAYQQDLERFYYDYAACLDEQRYGQWPDFFSHDCRYEILSRENFDRNLPAPLMSCYSHGMVADRVSMLIKNTLTYRKMYQKHFITNLRIQQERPLEILATANVLVIQSDLEGVSSLYIVGTYLDVISTAGGRFAISNRRVIVDSFGIDTMLAVPV